ncbi:DUF1761 domain-containing protein [Paenibacillus tyrfis]|uniref:DUF1761 domain-containing protein n=1 Tax=Paenibacillus tyrfis TaxID=1501230 RepID=A0A081P3A2_9BACL|nr:DUF1761 domain-containing protein [Paenibacillus tyrfis]KEQ25175.1 hypothetical protein ET33_05695 [Paenibacillus tyrfis]
MTTALAEINYWAVLAGAIFYMAFGALYYSPVLFGNHWIRLNRIQDGHMRNPLIYVASTIVAFLSSFFMAFLVHATGASGLVSGLILGLVVAVIIALVYLKNAAFGLMPMKVYAIAVGEHLLSFVVLGILNSVWQ